MDTAHLKNLPYSTLLDIVRMQKKLKNVIKTAEYFSNLGLSIGDVGYLCEIDRHYQGGIASVYNIEYAKRKEGRWYSPEIVASILDNYTSAKNFRDLTRNLQFSVTPHTVRNVCRRYGLRSKTNRTRTRNRKRLRDTGTDRLWKIMLTDKPAKQSKLGIYSY